MSKSTLLRAESLFLGVLLCLASMQAAFAQTEGSFYTSDSNKTTVHEINPAYCDLYLKQGESSSLNVNFKNNDKKAIEIEPKIIAVPYNY